MRINFTLQGTRLTGGTRVIFEVADRLAVQGHIISFTSLGFPEHRWFPFHDSVRFLYPELNRTITLPVMGRVTPKKFYDYYVEPRISYTLESTRLLAQATPTDVDVNIATHSSTAHAVHRSQSGTPFYYMQHYETLFYNDPYTMKVVDETYFLPLTRIANSSWLKNLLQRKFGVESHGPVIPGVDTQIFRPTPAERNTNERIVLALGKSGQLKGISTLFEALTLVRKEISNLKLYLYGNEPELKKHSPVPCEYMQRPSDAKLAELYCLAEAVVLPSLFESSPLPPLEAMACGAALVTTRPGTEDYCFNEENSLVVTAGEPKEMAVAILRILNDEDLRQKLRKKGEETARSFTWERTAKQVEELLREL